MMTKEQGQELLLKALSLRLNNSGSISNIEYTNLQKSCAMNKIYFFQNNLKRDIGYISWADINKESFLNLTKLGLNPQATYEWNEGYILLLLDITIPKNYPTKKLLKELKTIFPKRRLVLFNRKETINLYSKKNNRLKRFQIAENESQN